MGTDLIVAPGSIVDVSDGDVASAITDAKLLLICDRSGSIDNFTRARMSRRQIEDNIVADVQRRFPGKVVLIGFEDSAHFYLDGILPPPMGSTHVARALLLAKTITDLGINAALISDGEPTDDMRDILPIARSMPGLSTIYIGDPGDEGERTMREIANAAHGQCDVYDFGNPESLLKQIDRLTQHIEQLLLKAGR